MMIIIIIIIIKIDFGVQQKKDLAEIAWRKQNTFNEDEIILAYVEKK